MVMHCLMEPYLEEIITTYTQRGLRVYFIVSILR